MSYVWLPAKIDGGTVDTNMKNFISFREYAAKQGWVLENADQKMIGDVVNKIALKNPKIVPGATDQKDAARAMTEPLVKKMMVKNPAIGGQIGQALTGKEQSPAMMV